MVGDVTTPAITEGDLLFVISGSGETLSTLNMAKKAKSVGAEVILVTMVEKSSIADVADVKLVIDCPSAKHDTSHTASIQPMGSLFEQSVVLALDGGIISYLMHERNMDLQALLCAPCELRITHQETGGIEHESIVCKKAEFSSRFGTSPCGISNPMKSF